MRLTTTVILAMTLSFTNPATAALRCGSNFATPVPYVTGDFAQAAAFGDMNGDGKPDLVVANAGVATLTVLLNNGAGVFTFLGSYPAGGYYASSVELADVNRDGRLDAVIGLDSANKVSILYGTGTGGLGAPVLIANAGGPRMARVADLNRDGRPDIVTPNFTSKTVAILLADNAGGFLAPVNLPGGTNPTSVPVADINLDGASDILTANNGGDDSNSYVGVMLGNGNGTFQALVPVLTARSPADIVVGDLNRDGRPDLAVANVGNSSVSVLRGNGDGTFQPNQWYGTGGGPHGVRIADFNDDGLPDIAATSSSDNTVDVLLGNGDGTLQSRITYPSGGTDPRGFAAADLNADGRPDLAIAHTQTGNVTVLLGQAGSVNFIGFTNQGSLHTVGTTPNSLVAGDLNNDGRADLISANIADDSISVLLGSAAGSFQPETRYPAGDGPGWLVLADLNRDGRLDVVVSNFFSSTLSVLIGNGDGSFQPAVPYTISGGSRSVVAGDFNRDGAPDIAVVRINSYSLALLLGNGDGTLQGPLNFSTGVPGDALAAGDFNGDGKLDLAVGSSSDTPNVVILTGDGNGSLLNAGSFGSGFGPVRTLVAGDFNLDGRLDLLAARGSGFPNAFGTLWFGAGDGTFSAAVNSVVPETALAASMADYNGDGKPDFSVISTPTQFVFRAGDGTGSFINALGLSPGGEPHGIATGDFNGDGRLDVAITLQSQNRVKVHLNSPHFPASVSLISSASSVALGQPVTFTATVSSAVSSCNLPSGQLFFQANNISTGIGTGLGTFTLSGGVASVTTSSLTSGQYQVIAVYRGDSIFYSVQGAPASITVGKLPQSITGFALPNKSFGDAPFAISATGGGSGNPVVFTSNTLAVCTVSGNMVTISGAGTCSITATQNGNATYEAAAPVTASMTVAQAQQVITGFTLVGKTYGDAPFAVTATGGGSGNPVVFTSNTPAVCTVSGSTVTIVAAGACSITATQAGNTSYAAAAPVTAAMTVAQAQQVITGFTLTDRTYGDAPFALTATGGGSGNPVVFTSNTPAVCTVSGSTVTIVAAGACSITATQAGDANHVASAPVTAAMTVAQAQQFITGFSLTDKIFGDAPFLIAALGGGSGNPVVFTSNTPAVCAVSGSTVTITGVGACEIVAMQAGNANYYPAAPVVASMTVVDATAPVIAGPTLSMNPAALGSLVTISTTASDVATGNGNITLGEYSLDGGVTWQPFSGAPLGAPQVSFSVTIAPPAGVYAVCVRAADAAQNTATQCGAVLAVYDPAGGFVTGGGAILSPAGAYAADPALSGKASFGFVSKYLPGTSVPSGNTQFRFQAAGLAFKSTEYEWLVVSGARAQFKGSGAINGEGDYGFLLTAIDGQLPGGGTDAFRIRIWDKLTGATIYDNKAGSSETGSDATVLESGSIIIHKP